MAARRPTVVASAVLRYYSGITQLGTTQVLQHRHGLRHGSCTQSGAAGANSALGRRALGCAGCAQL